MPEKQRSFLYYFTLIFLPAIFISFMLLATVFYARYTSAKESLISRHIRQLELMHNEIEFTLNNIISDLSILSEVDQFKEFIGSNSLQSMESVEAVFKLFCVQRRVYDQVRFLDEAGMEIIRVNYNNGRPQIVSQNNLQFKGNRYYFKDTFLLEKGKIFFSPLDLNIEGGNIEIPINPMVRVGIPVFDEDGNKKGIILLNYFGQNIIDIVLAYTKSTEDNFYLLNPYSYWLYSKDPEKNWSFMYEDRQEQNFSNVNTDIWNSMLSLDTGILKNSDSTYIFITVSPLHEHMETSTGSSTSYGKSSSLDSDDYFWKIVSDLPNTLFYSLAWAIVISMMLLISSVIIVALLLSIMLAKLWYLQKLSEQQVQKSLEEKELLLREIHHRVKNSLALVSSFVGLYQMESHDGRHDSFFDTLHQKIDTISLVHTYLYKSSDIENINIKLYLKDLLENMLDSLVISTGKVILDLGVEDIFMSAKPAITIGLIISELTINSLKYAFPGSQEGKISLEITTEGSDYILVYSDDGVGLPTNFDIKNSDSLGMILIESLIEQLNGILSISTGTGSAFAIRFPVPYN